jgi:citrate synthase
MAEKCSYINPELYTKYEVKRGLRDISGRGVLAGLTEIGEVHAYIIDENEMVPCEGKLYYRGYDIQEIVKGFLKINALDSRKPAIFCCLGRSPIKPSWQSLKRIWQASESSPMDLFVT